jgi:hypothetical protein
MDHCFGLRVLLVEYPYLKDCVTLLILYIHGLIFFFNKNKGTDWCSLAINIFAVPPMSQNRSVYFPVRGQNDFQGLDPKWWNIPNASRLYLQYS